VTEDDKLLSLELGDEMISATLLLCEVEQFGECESSLEKWLDGFRTAAVAARR